MFNTDDVSMASFHFRFTNFWLPCHLVTDYETEDFDTISRSWKNKYK